VIRALARHRRLHSDAHYYAVREGWNLSAPAPAADRAAAFLYLNKTCYNGLWRVNRRGAFNVPVGRYQNPSILDEDALRAAAQALAGQILEVARFEAIVETAERGDFVYFDPPYHPVSDTSHFTSYTADKFGAEDQERLAQVFRALDARGCAVMLSNSDTPFTRGLYAGYRIDRVWCARAINSKGDRRGVVPEVIVTNRY
jgi:DNA adenine methylase